MSRHEEMCSHCRAKTAETTADRPVEAPAPPELPTVPTPMRVHTEGLPPFDCTLHPDGTLTAVVGGEVRRNWLTFADMCARNWALAHFELNPAPLTVEPEPEQAEIVQDVLAL